MEVAQHEVALSVKYEPRNITGRPCISIMGLGGVACGPTTCYPSEAFFFFVCVCVFFPSGLVQLYSASLKIRSYWTTGAPSVQGAFPNVQFSFLAAAGFEPTSLSLQCGRVTAVLCRPPSL